MTKAVERSSQNPYYICPMNNTTTYTIQELLNKFPANADLKNLDWSKDESELEFDLSSIIGGDWMVDRQNNTVTNLH